MTSEQAATTEQSETSEQSVTTEQAETNEHAESNEQAPARAPHRWRKTKITLTVLLAVVLVVGIIGAVTPWPSAMIIRAVFTQGGEATVAEMNRHVPDTELTETLDVAYASGSDSADSSGSSDSSYTTMDVFTPASATGPLPTVVWIHGGAWISGSKEDVAPYLRILAGEGYTTIGLNYTRGPEGTYPLAVEQLNDALAYIDSHAAELNVDPSQIVLAGDSAGAQLASQLATMITSPDYADLMDLAPALSADQLVATVLNCGVYDLAALAELDGLAGWGLKTSMWAYAGTKTWAESAPGAMMSTVDFVTADFPATYISGGNGDGLTWLQSIPMAQRLAELDVDTTTLFWPAPHQPALAHEYQFHLDLPEAQTALQETIDFLDAHTD